MGEAIASGGKSRKVQVRKGRGDGWTEAKRRVFLDHLAATCNVRASAAAAGMGEHSAYALRRRDAGFAEQWQAAVATGYAAIEAMLMARAMCGANGGGLEKRSAGGGTEKDGGSDGGGGQSPNTPPDLRQLDTDLALDLMRRRDAAVAARGKGGPPMRTATAKELVDALAKRIGALQKRREGKG